MVARIVAAFRAEGADSWYSSPPSRFLGNDRNPDDYEQVMDIVDVWFEAGSTHAFVLEARNLPWPADLYLEGSDQHRGWFQSSLLEAVGTRGVAPFKAVLTDGFVMDEQGRKMSKSLGNVTAPQEVADKYGVDILRLWVMMSDTSEDLRIGPEILKQQVELYRRLRNTLRWLLGSLAGFSDAERVPYADMPELEKWVLHRLAELDARIRASVQSYDWTGVYPELHNFCATDLSAFYFDVRKDAIYCDRPDSLRRRAARTRAGSSASLPDHVARAGAVLHRGGSLVRAVRRAGQRASAALPGRAGRVARRRAGGALGDDPRDPPAHHRADRGGAPGQHARVVAAGGGGAAAEARPERLLTEDQWAEIAIVSNVRIAADPKANRWRRSVRRPGTSARAAGGCCRRWVSRPGIRRCACAVPMRWSPGWFAGPRWHVPASPAPPSRKGRGRDGRSLPLPSRGRGVGGSG